MRATLGCPVEVPVGGLDQLPGRRFGAVSTVGFSAKAIQPWSSCPGGDFEDCAMAVGAAVAGCAVEVPIGSLDQPGRPAVSAASLGAKAVKRGQRGPGGWF